MDGRMTLDALSGAAGSPWRQPRWTILAVAGIWTLIQSYFAVFRLLWPWSPVLVPVIVAGAAVSTVVWSVATLSLIPIVRRLALGERRLRDIIAIGISLPLVPGITRLAEHFIARGIGTAPITWKTLTYVLTPFAAATSAMAIVIASVLASREESSERERRAFELGALLMRSRAERLRARISPSFMAAVLDSISREIEHDREEADRMLIAFAEFLRSVLDVEREPAIALEDELELIDRFIRLAPVATALQLHVDDQALELRIPPLLVYPVVALFVEERATHIGLAAELRDDLKIRITAACALTAGEASARLHALRHRLEHLYPARNVLRTDASSAVHTITMSLPFCPSGAFRR
jgi:hypothetical protein